MRPLILSQNRKCSATNSSPPMAGDYSQFFRFRKKETETGKPNAKDKVLDSVIWRWSRKST